MWTTEAWMPYPPTGEITGSQPRVGCRHVTCRTVRVWWWNFPEKPASQNHWLCLGGIFRDGSRPRATCEMITWGLTYIFSMIQCGGIFPRPEHFYQDWKCCAWSAQVISSCKIKELFLILSNGIQIHVVPCSSDEVTAKDRLSTGWAKDCLSKGLNECFLKTKMSTWSLGVSSQTFFWKLCQTKTCLRGGSFSMIFTFSWKSVKCGFDIMGDI